MDKTVEPQTRDLVGRRRPHKHLTAHWFMRDEIVSGLQKYIRRNNYEKALFCAYELVKSGEPGAVWNRLFVILFEDVGFHRVDVIGQVTVSNDAFYSLVTSQLDGKVSNVWKHPEIYSHVEVAIRSMCSGSKTRIASHIAAAVLSPKESLTTEIPIDLTPQQKAKVDDLLLVISSKASSLIERELYGFASALFNKQEGLCFYYAGRLFLINDKMENKYVITKHKPVGIENIEFENPGDLLWALLVSQTTDSDSKIILELTYERTIKQRKGSPRLALFSMLLAYLRPHCIETCDEGVKEPLPAWVRLMFEDKDCSNKEHVFAIRQHFVIDPFVLDKHTSVGKGTGRNTLDFLDKFLVSCQLPLDWFSEEEKKRSHRRKEDVPAENRTFKFFFREGARVSLPATRIANPYEELAFKVYSDAEASMGVLKAKVKHISEAYFTREMSDFATFLNSAKRVETDAKPKRDVKRVKKALEIPKRVELRQLTPGQMEQLIDLSVPRGQKRTGKSKKDVVIPTSGEFVGKIFKGPYDITKKLLRFMGRSEIFKFLESSVLLPEAYYVSPERKVFICFQNLATTLPSEWKTSENIEHESFGGRKVQVIDRESLGIKNFGEILSADPKDVRFLSIYKALLDAFILGVGDMHFGNVLAAGDKAWLIDYEDDSHRDLEKVTLEDFVFKAPPSAQVREYVKAIYKENKESLVEWAASLHVIHPTIREIAMEFPIDLLHVQKRISVVKKLFQ